MEIELISDVTIGGKKISYVIGFQLTQAFNTHHYFELHFNHDLLGAPGLINLDDSRDLLGKTLTASFGRASGTPQKFLGIVTHVSLAQSHGYHGIVVAKGYSPTILLDRGADLASYYNKSLAEVVKIASRDTAANDLRMAINPVRQKPIKQLFQYAESDFAFLNRLSAEYQEWFYYDGECLQFGKGATQEEVHLVYGREIEYLDYGIGAAPLQSRQFAYDMQQDTLLQASAKGEAAGMPDLVHAASTAKALYSKTYNRQAIPPVENSGELSKLVEEQDKGRVSGLLKVKGRSDQPAVGIGKLVDISMSVRQGAAFVTQSIGKFLVISISHEIDMDGRYQNHFEAILSTAEQLPLHPYEQPRPEMLLAEVFDHADPLQIGRVRVKFKWLADQNDPSDWLRVMSPDAGNSAKLPKNRGMVFVPEKGDQVLVGFEDGNLNKPIVMGSLFHGKNAGGGGADNDQKSISSKSGHAIRFDDKAGLIIQDKTDLNYVSVDGKDTIVIQADKRIHLRAGKVQILLDGAEDKITLQAGHIAIKAAETFELTGDGGPTQTGRMAFAKDLQIVSKQTLTIAGEQKASVNGSNIHIAGSKTTIEGNPVNINS